MFKKYFFFAAIVAVLISCGKEPAIVQNNNPNPNSNEKTLVINASFGLTTKVDYSQAEDGGYKATFNEKDYLQMWFHKPGGASAGSTIAVIDPNTISADGGSASFIVNYAEMPESVDYVFAGLCYSGCEYSPNGVNLTSQTGLEINALNHCLIAGKCMTSDIKATEGGMSVPLKLEHRTSIFKLVLTLPEGADAQPAGTQKPSTISITNANNTIHNYVNLAWGSFNGKETKGAITTKPAKVEKDGTVITSYITVWAEDKFDGSKITVTTENGVYTTDFTPTAAISAGKIYTVARTLSVPSVNESVWKSDEAGSVNFASAAGETLTEGWLSCKDNKISWEANTTGAPRSAKLTFKNGSTYEVYQIGPADFAGAWDMYVFNYYKGKYTNGAYKAERVGPQGDFVVDEGKLSEAQHRDITIGTMTPEEVTSTKDGKHTHNITIDGFSDPGLKAKSEVAIDYANKKAYLNIYFMQPLLKDVVANPTAGEHFTEAGFSDKYAWLMPALNSANTLKGSYQLGFATLTQDNQAWYQGVVTAEGSSLKVKWTSNQVAGNLQVLKTTGKSYIYGIMVNPYSNGGTKIGTDIAAGTLVKNGSNAAYQYCYQGDMIFVKK